MVLSGWTQAPAKEDNNISANNGASTSNTSQAVSLETVEVNEIQIVPTGAGSVSSGTKRKLSDMSDAADPDHSSVITETSKEELQELDDDDGDDVVMIDDVNSDGSKKKRLQ
ncbi:hypothetical protein CsSME_00009337 [Camellia sinensis var. sinensis]